MRFSFVVPRKVILSYGRTYCALVSLFVFFPNVLFVFVNCLNPVPSQQEGTMTPWYLVFILVFVISAFMLNDGMAPSFRLRPKLRENIDVNDTKAANKTRRGADECTREGHVGIYNNEGLTTQHVDMNIPMTDLKQSSVEVVGKEHRTGDEVAVRITSRDANGNRICSEGDMYEMMAESPLEIAGIKIRSKGQGVYEGSFKPRRKGSYKVCVRLYYTARLQGVPRWGNGTYQPYNFSALSRMHLTSHTSLGNPKEWCSGTKPDLNPTCITVDVTGPDVLPSQPCSPDYTGGLEGSWLYTAPPYSCSPGFCTGDLRFMDIDGWLFVPNICYLRFFNRDSAWECLQNQNILFFGDSTLRQTVSNLVENLMGTPVLGDKSYKWAKAHCNVNAVNVGKRKKCYSPKCVGKALGRRYCPDLNTMRKWGGVRYNPTDRNTSFTAQFVWGGGVKRYTKWGIRPSAFDHFQKTRYGYACTKSFCTQARAEFTTALRGNPNHVVLNGFLWDLDIDIWETFYHKVKNTILMVKEMAPNAKIHWNLAHPQCTHSKREYKDVDELSYLCWRTVGQKSQMVAADHNNMLLARSLKRDFPEVSVVDRYSTILGHVNGHNFCHQGMHFGASPSDCLLFTLTSTLDEGCSRNWRVDKMLGQLMLNGMCPSSSPLLRTSDATISINSGVPKAIGNWLGIPGTPDPED